MVFLIEYARSEGRIVTMREYGEDERLTAEDERLNLELRRSSEGIEREIVLLDAVNLDALKRTHSRYFEVSEWPQPDMEWPDGEFPPQTPEEP